MNGPDYCASSRTRLASPCCGAELQPLLEYRSGSYSEHRDWTGTECSECGNEWDTDGTPRAAGVA